VTGETKVVDARGLLCPLPVLRARKALSQVAPGGRIELRATDPAAARDVRAFCHETGHALESATEDSGLLTFVIRRKP
jgi:tRNA 2-thiouridine synthesizing protein A